MLSVDCEGVILHGKRGLQEQEISLGETVDVLIERVFCIENDSVKTRMNPIFLYDSFSI